MIHIMLRHRMLLAFSLTNIKHNFQYSLFFCIEEYRLNLI